MGDALFCSDEGEGDSMIGSRALSLPPSHTVPTLTHCQMMREVAITAMATLVASLANELPAQGEGGSRHS